jgi:hypothetical protein
MKRIIYPSYRKRDKIKKGPNESWWINLNLKVVVNVMKE